MKKNKIGIILFSILILLKINLLKTLKQTTYKFIKKTLLKISIISKIKKLKISLLIMK